MAKESASAGRVTGKAGGAAALHVPDVPVAAGGKAEGKKGRSAMKITILTLLIVILLAGLGLGGWYLLGSASASVPPQEGEGAEAEGAADGSQGGETSKSAAPKVTGLLALEPFTVNLADTETTRYIRLSVKLGLNSVEAVESFRKDEIVNAKVRDLIIGLLGSLAADEVLSSDGKAKLRKDIAEKTNALLGEGQVLEVYFIELVVQ